MNFSARLKELRESKGLSQEELASALNIPRSSITNYESEDNLRLPRHERLKKIADFFNVPVDYILGGAKDEAYYQFAPTDEIRDIINSYEDIDDIIKQFYVNAFNRNNEHDLELTYLVTEDPKNFLNHRTIEELFKSYDFDFKLQYLHAMVDDAKLNKIDFEEYLKQNKVTFKKKKRSNIGKAIDLFNILNKPLESHSVKFLLGEIEDDDNNNDYIDFDDVIKIPIYGEIKAGYDFVGEQNITGYEYTSKKSVSDGEYFYLIVRGDSMIDDGIFEGCRVLVRKQGSVENGKIGVCIVNDEETTLKRVYYEGDKVILVASNKRIPPKTYDISDVKIQGQVKSYMVDL